MPRKPVARDSRENVLHAIVPQTQANDLKKILLSRGWLFQDSNPARAGVCIGFPLKQEAVTESDQKFLQEVFPEIRFESLPLQMKKHLRPRTLAEVFEGTLPQELITLLPKSLDIIGTVAVVEKPRENPDTLNPYWDAIGQAVIKVNPGVESVFLKASAIEGEYRTREMQCIAGPDVTETVHKENECAFKIDLRRVFFSPRLVTERARVAHLVKLENELVLDMFAGVGPFAIQRAKVQGVRVIAVDKNPDAVQYLRINVELNKVSHLITPVCADIAEVGKGELVSIGGQASRIIMNLPERAIEFLPQAVYALSPKGGIIHLYQFAGGQDPLQEAERKFRDALKNAKGELVNLNGVKIVKPYAPYEYLTVVDALCRPLQES